MCRAIGVVGASPAHVPVLLREVSELLDPRVGDVVVDATVGMGGHARVFAEMIGASGRLIGLDVDPENLAAAREHLSDCPCSLELCQANFTELRDVLASLGVSRVAVLLADLGVSSAQLDDAARGFSFQQDGPLDMRLDRRLTVTAADLVNRLKEKELGDLLYFNAQERASRKIAKRICAIRREGRITTTAALARIVGSVLRTGSRGGPPKLHPATRTFLALRMAVNDEIPSLEHLLTTAPDVLQPGGRFGVIAFHSVEDKPVKVDFRRRKAEGVYELVTKKPIIPTEQERRSNRRSRSAKLRVAVRLPRPD